MDHTSPKTGIDGMPLANVTPLAKMASVPFGLLVKAADARGCGGGVPAGAGVIPAKQKGRAGPLRRAPPPHPPNTTPQLYADPHTHNTHLPRRGADVDPRAARVERDRDVVHGHSTEVDEHVQVVGIVCAWLKCGTALDGVSWE